MRRYLLPLLILLASLAAAQTETTYDTVKTKQIVLEVSTPPQKVRSASIQSVGNSGPRSLYYWIVTNNAAGASAPSGPFPLSGGPNALSPSANVSIGWSPVAGAVSYDVLRTVTNAVPTGTCNCAVATAVSGTSAVDQSEILSAYTVQAVDVQSMAVTLTNQATGPGQSSLQAKQNGTTVGLVLPNQPNTFTAPQTFGTIAVGGDITASTCKPIRGVIVVTDCGAVAGGTSGPDNISAFVAAFAAAKGGEVILPPSSSCYGISANLQLVKGVNEGLHFHGLQNSVGALGSNFYSRICALSGLSAPIDGIRVAANSVEIDHLYLDGTGVPWVGNSIVGNGIVLDSAGRSYIHDNSFRYWPLSGILQKSGVYTTSGNNNLLRLARNTASNNGRYGREIVQGAGNDNSTQDLHSEYQSNGLDGVLVRGSLNQWIGGMYSTNIGLPLRISLGGAVLNTTAAAALTAGTSRNIVLGTNSGVVQYQTLRVNAGLTDQEDVIVTAVNGDGVTVTVAKLRSAHAAGSTWTNLTDAGWTTSNSIFHPSDLEANLGNFIYSDCKSENNSIYLAYTASYWKGCSGALDMAMLIGGWCTGVADESGCQQLLSNGGSSWLTFYPGTSATSGTGIISFGGTNSNIAGSIISQGASPVRVNYSNAYSASYAGTGGFQVGSGSISGGLLGGLDSTGLYFGCAGNTTCGVGAKFTGTFTAMRNIAVPDANVTLTGGTEPAISSTVPTVGAGTCWKTTTTLGTCTAGTWPNCTTCN
jgi:hypothetical protein